MARITNLELTQLLAARNGELEAARLRIAELEGDVAALDAKLERATFAIIDSDVARGELLAEVAQLKARPQREPSAEQLAYRAALAQARDDAMRTGRSVKVEVRA